MILSGIVTPVCLSHDHDLLAEYARILKPSGLLIIREPTVEQGTVRYHIMARVGEFFPLNQNHQNFTCTKLSSLSLLNSQTILMMTVLLEYVML